MWSRMMRRERSLSRCLQDSMALAGPAQSLDPPHSVILTGSFKTVVRVVAGSGGLSSSSNFQTTYDIPFGKCSFRVMHFVKYLP